MTYYGGPARAFYRRNEIDRSNSREPYLTAFAEYRPTGETTITFGLDNAADVPIERERTFYKPDRRTPEPFLYEFRDRNKHIIPYISLKHSFG